MPSESSAPDRSGAPVGIEHILALLNEALEAVDALDLSPAIGARIQEVISSIEESAKS